MIKRIYIPPNRGDECQYCGNDGMNIITCDHCEPTPERNRQRLRDTLKDIGAIEQ
jgi:hypothetical protein